MMRNAIVATTCAVLGVIILTIGFVLAARNLSNDLSEEIKSVSSSVSALATTTQEQLRAQGVLQEQVAAAQTLMVLTLGNLHTQSERVKTIERALQKHDTDSHNERTTIYDLTEHGNFLAVRLRNELFDEYGQFIGLPPETGDRCLYGAMSPDNVLVISWEDIGPPPPDWVPYLLCYKEGGLKSVVGLEDQEIVIANPRSLEFLNIEE